MFKCSAALTTCFVTAGLIIYTSLFPAHASETQSPSNLLALAPGFSPAPQIIMGMSGGDRETSDCGFIKDVDAPDYVLNITEEFTFLRASIQAEGDVTMMVEGPNGRICSDDVNGLMPELSGPVPIGTYYIWVGDYVGNPQRGFRYKLVLSEE